MDFLEIDELRDARLAEDVVTAAPQLKPEGFDQHAHVTEGDVRERASTQPPKKPSGVHTRTVGAGTDRDQPQAGNPGAATWPRAGVASVMMTTKVSFAELSAAYEDAWQEWEASDEAALWDAMVGDGLPTPGESEH